MGTLKEIKKLLSRLAEFRDSMLEALLNNYHEKGFSWRTEDTTRDYLIDKLKEHANAEKWVNVANFAFMLWEIDTDE